jgi:NAD(P)-dependent dehydrogenase (short-subunit alcohol dehydrogenase family)
VDVPTDVARENFEVKFWGSYYVARHMRLLPGGSFTLFSGAISRMPFQSVVTVSIINAALEALTRGLAFELAPIRVNCISPGTIDTPAWQHISDAARASLFERTRASLPLRRVGNSADVAAAALMVMQNPFMTGVVLDVDGGALLGNPVP